MDKPSKQEKVYYVLMIVSFVLAGIAVTLGMWLYIMEAIAALSGK